MKLSSILATLADAGLPSVSGEQLQQLVGTAEGKAFAEDLTSYAAGDTTRRSHIAAVVHSLAPFVHDAVEQMGLQFNLRVIIGAAKRDGVTCLRRSRLPRTAQSTAHRRLATCGASDCKQRSPPLPQQHARSQRKRLIIRSRSMVARAPCA